MKEFQISKFEIHRKEAATIDHENAPSHGFGRRPDDGPRLDLLAVDASQMKITVRENGVEKNYAIPSGPVPWPGTNRLALANASIPDTIDLLSLLTDRVVLFHPESVAAISPQIQCHWTNSSTTKVEAALAIENSWKTHGVATALLGSNFLILAPSSRTNEILYTLRNPASKGTRIPPFTLRNINEALKKHTDLTGQVVICPKQFSDAWFYLRTMKPVTEQEAIFSLRTLLRWGGCQTP